MFSNIYCAFIFVSVQFSCSLSNQNFLSMLFISCLTIAQICWLQNLHDCNNRWMKMFDKFQLFYENKSQDTRNMMNATKFNKWQLKNLLKYCLSKLQSMSCAVRNFRNIPSRFERKTNVFHYHISTIIIEVLSQYNYIRN